MARRRNRTNMEQQAIKLKRLRKAKRVHLDFKGNPTISLGTTGHGSSTRFYIESRDDLAFRYNKRYVIECSALIWELKLESVHPAAGLYPKNTYYFEVLNTWYVGRALPHLGLDAFREARTVFTTEEQILLDSYKNPIRA